ILFYGSSSEYRFRLLNELCEQGLRVVFACGLYGASRDNLIARSKIVLNLNKYAESIFEIARVSYLLANRKAVVSDIRDNTFIELDIFGAVEFARPEALANACIRLIADDKARTDLATRGEAIMRKRDIRSILSELNL